MGFHVELIGTKPMGMLSNEYMMPIPSLQRPLCSPNMGERVENFPFRFRADAGNMRSLSLECVAVAKLSKALAWLSCARSRERPEFKSQLRRTLANSANYMSIGVVNE